MALDLDPATREALVTRVRFYRDLGLSEFYRRPVDPALVTQLAFEVQDSPAQSQNMSASGLASEAWKSVDQKQPLGERV